MHFLLNPVGSHGDVHPFLALGLGLQARGHRVTVVTAGTFARLAERHRFGFRPTATEAEYEAMTANPDLWHPRKSFSVLFASDMLTKQLRTTFAHVRDLYTPGETVLVTGSLGIAARLANEALGVPLATVNLQPVALASVVSPPLFPTVRMRSWWPHWLRRLAYAFGARFVMDPRIGPPLNAFRQELGLPPVRNIWFWKDSPQLVLNLFPEWYALAPDWPPQCRSVGFLRYDQADAGLPPGVEQFLNDGPPPVVVSLGSAMRTGQRYFAAAVEACRRLRVRGLLLARGRHQVPAPLPPGVAHFDYAPFSRVFPRAAAVVHHGGIGTTAQALVAGVPQVVMPLAFDQPDNAERLEQLGVARAVPAAKFTPGRAAAALTAVLDGREVRAACAKCQARFAGPDPVDQACRLVEGLVGTDGRSHSG
jgi:UDP:flavonoid glycosyltransferase YjiC (YdhE family)